MQVTLYNRDETDVLRLPRSELQIHQRVLVRPLAISRWRNALDGYAADVDFLVQRRARPG